LKSGGFSNRLSSETGHGAPLRCGEFPPCRPYLQQLIEVGVFSEFGTVFPKMEQTILDGQNNGPIRQEAAKPGTTTFMLHKLQDFLSSSITFLFHFPKSVMTYT
jgi:hypothetical protein